MSPGAYLTFSLRLSSAELDAFDAMIEQWRDSAPFLHITRDVVGEEDDALVVSFTMVTEEAIEDPEETVVGWIKLALAAETQRWE